MKDKILSIAEKDLGETPKSFELVEEGLMHETYSLSYESRDYILQFSENDDEDHSALEQCLNFYQLLEDSQIPVPKPVTEHVAVFEEESYTIVEKLPGNSMKSDITPEKVKKAGRMLAKIHDYRRFDRSGWIVFDKNDLNISEFEEGDQKQKILRDVEQKIQVYEEDGMTDLAETIENFFNSYSEELPEDFQPILFHDDFTPDNILYQNRKITGVIDWDFAFSGHDQRNLVKAANGFWMHDPGADWDIRETLYEGYQEIRELDDSFQQNESIYRVETLFQLVGSMIKMNEFSQEEKDFYREEITEYIDRIAK